MIKADKFRKYFFYILGEILLIVVGILIAIQVADRVEANKKRKEEVALLQEIKLDLVEMRREISGDLESHLDYQRSGNIFKAYLSEQPQLNDTILYHFERMAKDRQVYPKNSGYSLLEAKGMDQISNDSIRIMINDFYQLLLVRLLEFGQNNERNSIPALLAPYQKQYLQLTAEVDDEDFYRGLDSPIVEYKVRLDRYEDLRHDNNFLLDLQSSFQLRKRKIGRHQAAIAAIDVLLTHLDRELKE